MGSLGVLPWEEQLCDAQTVTPKRTRPFNSESSSNSIACHSRPSLLWPGLGLGLLLLRAPLLCSSCYQRPANHCSLSTIPPRLPTCWPGSLGALQSPAVTILPRRPKCHSVKSPSCIPVAERSHPFLTPQQRLVHIPWGTRASGDAGPDGKRNTVCKAAAQAQGEAGGRVGLGETGSLKEGLESLANFYRPAVRLGLQVSLPRSAAVCERAQLDFVSIFYLQTFEQRGKLFILSYSHSHQPPALPVGDDSSKRDRLLGLQPTC